MRRFSIAMCVILMTLGIGYLGVVSAEPPPTAIESGGEMTIPTRPRPDTDPPEEGDDPPVQAGRVPTVGLNGATCAFETIGAAIAAAANRTNTIYIESGTYTEILGEIDKDITFVPARGGSSCTLESASATSSSVIIDGGGGSDDGTGGLAEITGRVTVTFRHMWLRNTTATNGGVIAVTDGAELVLDDALVTDGDAAATGGVLYASGGSEILLDNDSSVYRGNTNNGDGGAIALFSASLTINDGNIGVSSNNGFSTAGGNGGGIYASQSTVILTEAQSKIIWNESGQRGGGIYAIDSAVTINGGEVSSNTTGNRGAGIYHDGDDTLIIHDATIANNTTTTAQTNGGGGGIYTVGADVTVNNSVISGNHAVNSGGGINGYGGSTVTLENGTIIENNTTGSSGGGVSVRDALIIDDSIVRDNTANSNGGGLYCFVCDLIMVTEGSVIDGNSAEDGGGIYILGSSTTTSVQLDNVQITNNAATDDNDTNSAGGGIRAYGVDMHLNNVHVQNNTANDSGGGIFLDAALDRPSTATITNSNFIANSTQNSTSHDGGGAIYAEDDVVLSIDGATFDQNESTNIGGAIQLRGGAELTMRNSHVNQNTAAIGAGVSIDSGTHLIENSYFTGNNSSGSGGGIRIVLGNLTVRNSEIIGNIADSGAGLFAGLTPTTLENIKLQFNHARNTGGGMYISSSPVTMMVGADCLPSGLGANQYCSEVSGNSADELGGGIHILSGSSPNHQAIVDIQHTYVGQNTALDGGTAIYLYESYTPTVRITNTLIADNGTNGSDIPTVENRGAGVISLHSSTVANNFGSPLWVISNTATTSLYNSILYLNSVGPRVVFGSQFSRSCNNSQTSAGSSLSMGGISQNPQFDGSHPRGDYRLLSTSPSVDACNNGVSADTDLLGRPAGASYDQGAFELNGVPTVVSVSGQRSVVNGQWVKWGFEVLLGLTLLWVRGRPRSHS